jgi:hypothetical protein
VSDERVPNSVFAVELDKDTINAIKSAAREEIHCTMMQGRNAVLPMRKQRGEVIDKVLKKAHISVIGQGKFLHTFTHAGLQ